VSISTSIYVIGIGEPIEPSHKLSLTYLGHSSWSPQRPCSIHSWHPC